MKYPSLVKSSVCKSEIEVTIYSKDTDENGAPITLFSKKLKCNYQGSAKRRYDEKRNVVELHGVALFNGDVFQDVNEITSGEVFIYGEKRKIYKGYKERNPDGTVNYTRLELI